MMIQSTVLKGHQKAVLCLDHSSSSSSRRDAPPTSTTTTTTSSSVTASSAGSLLLSGSEDGTARLWDLKCQPLRASLCIQAPNGGEVLSVAFGPKWGDSAVVAAAAADSAFAREYSVYLATGNSIYGYDLRKATCPVLKEASANLSFLEFEDEVNQIVFSPPTRTLSGGGSKGNKRGRTPTIPRTLLAAGDDAGTVRVTESFDFMPTTTSTKQPKRRIYQHQSADQFAVVTSLAFRPRAKGIELASGGTDCQIHLWDATKESNKSLITSVRIPNTDVGANQVCNPPMVHSLDWSPSGRLLAAAHGDGSIAIVQAENRSLVTVARLEDAHGGAVASVLFPEWCSSKTISEGSPAVTAQDRLLCSIGNDGAIVLWDLGTSICGEKAIPPSEVLLTPPSKAVNQPLESSFQSLNLTEQPTALFAWQHNAKPNWMASSRGVDPMFPSSLFIADTTNDITVYTVPTL